MTNQHEIGPRTSTWNRGWRMRCHPPENGIHPLGFVTGKLGTLRKQIGRSRTDEVIVCRCTLFMVVLVIFVRPMIDRPVKGAVT